MTREIFDKFLTNIIKSQDEDKKLDAFLGILNFICGEEIRKIMTSDGITKLAISIHGKNCNDVADYLLMLLHKEDINEFDNIMVTA